MMRHIGKVFLLTGTLLTVASLVQAQDGGGGNAAPESAMLGGAWTVFDASDEAFTHEVAGLSEEELVHFEEGDEAFEREFDESQIGPFFDATSCEACHLNDGRGQPFTRTSFSPTVVNTTSDENPAGNTNANNNRNGDGNGRRGNRDGNSPPPRDGNRPPRNDNGQRQTLAPIQDNPQPAQTDEFEQTGFVVLLSTSERDLNGHLPDATYGGQFQAQAIEGVSPEGIFVIEYEEISGTYDDGTPYTLRRPVYRFDNLAYGNLAEDITFSPRVAPQIIGLGLLEAVPEADILALADPNDADGDGVSGRPNYVWDAYNNTTALGRFGWKANNPHLLQQAAGAYFNDMGLTNSIFSDPSCFNPTTACASVLDGIEPEISDDELLATTFYTQTLSVPAQRNFNDSLVQEGALIFEEAGCSSCHTATLVTGTHPTVPALSNQVIHPYTDLLLHDMGEDLADGRPHGLATGSEWRTPPLWGIGLFETVNGHTTYMHDGRARNLSEAIIWHGGEAEVSREYFLGLSADERAALLAFLESL